MKADTQPARVSGCAECHAAHYQAEGSCTSCHGGDPTARRQRLAHHKLIFGRAAEHGLAGSRAVAEGERLVESLACRRCHTIGSAGNRVAANLDLVVRERGQIAVARSIRKPVENMPRFGLDNSQIEGVIAALLRAAGPGPGEATYRVHFRRRRLAPGSTFEQKCGGCHRALLAQGPAGRGSAGPNLSGLFTPFYPATAPGARSWTSGTLETWLRTPRLLRPRTTMRPVRLQVNEWEALSNELGASEGQ